MKKMYWNLYGKEVMFTVNWFEYLVLKRIFEKKKYEILKPNRGRKIDLVISDEAADFDFIKIKEHSLRVEPMKRQEGK